MDTEVPATAPALAGTVIFDQRWCDLAFLHWPVESDAVARWMPRGARVDTFEGSTYVGLVPFQMRAARLGRHLPAPYFGSFGEVNVRLYSVDDEGRHGVVFRSLDASRLAVATVAKLFGVPYVWSRVSARDYPSTADDPFPAEVDIDRRWEVRRRSGLSSTVALRVGQRVEPTPLEVFLTARWGMHSELAGRSVWVPNQHGTWPLHDAELTEFDDDLVRAAGISTTGPMLRPLWSPGVRSRFARPSLGLPSRMR